MSSVTVRISLPARDQLRELAEQMGKSMQAVVEEALELYRRRCFLEEVNAAHGELRQDPQAWSEVEEERALWDGTLADGLADD
jgi:predicted transcriptional regulator